VGTTIEVKEHHILKGRRRCALFCPVALALRDIGMSEPVVATKELTYRDKLIPLPQNVKDFIYKFDRREDVAPFTFELEL
jgi:hypothetical protein